MGEATKVLIIGAGPAGLAAGLFLARRGIAVRIIDAACEPAANSKALGVNPRTLDLLDDTGVTARILVEAQPINALRLLRNGRDVSVLRPNWAAMGARHGMVILPQARTETLLLDALASFGVAPERNKSLTALAQDAAGVTTSLSDGEMARTSVLLAADGAHSTVRQAIGLGFPGDAWEESWRLMDVDLTGPSPNEAWIDLRDDGALVVLPFSGRRFRVMGVGGALLERLPTSWTQGPVHWTSEFRVSHRMVEAMSIGRICLAGDAAHVHSPMGARGMNLGIEDAYVFAACAADFLFGDADRLAAYGRLRHAVDRSVVHRVRSLTAFARDTSPPTKMMKSVLTRIAGRLPVIVNHVLKVGMGLDHPITLR